AERRARLRRRQYGCALSIWVRPQLSVTGDRRRLERAPATDQRRGDPRLLEWSEWVQPDDRRVLHRVGDRRTTTSSAAWFESPG
ncbi:MAG: hypothetical protein JW751_05665, partial [Polyangiaceae bacterium]|nr:hypothetical protein [Polyangiaceae bacterium]